MDGGAGLEPKGPRFTKLYDKGLERIGHLVTLKGGPTVTQVWVFLVRHCGHDNALCCPAEVMAGELGVSRRSIIRAIKILQDNGAIVVAKMGTANLYILNDQEVWKTYEEHRRFCGFRARALVGFKDNPALKKRLTHMTGKKPPASVSEAAKNAE
jgi:biotin operon repressor